MRTVRIRQIIKENRTVKTFYFRDHLCSKARPGQFAMVWLPRFDEVPMSISSTDNSGLASMTVAKVGDATKRLHEKKKGDIIGIRGPFGRSFELVKGNVLLVGGGTGISPLIFLGEELAKHTSSMTILIGAKTEEDLLFLSRVERLRLDVIPSLEAAVSTEDGSYGYAGLVTELVKMKLEGEKFDMIYACGKENMLLNISLIARKHRTKLQACLERFMRCAIGLCGSCTIGKYRVCTDGPVFTEKQLEEIGDEFGLLKRDLDGSQVKL
ncbi:MAG: dihydroorotate dehydrogenase electron transfer subunit [Candidatus Bathyarchaeota archaeon]|nr:MAG: dihydroorotate dehydrogenase electron transfer subunit [Candidatus Bathyarchaeota archaeon]